MTIKKGNSTESRGLGELTKINQEWVDASKKAKKYEGVKKLLSQFYPDSAHFIIELLQNAEDVQATHVIFKLENDQLIFEHDGKVLFSYEDVEAITNIGESTKINDNTSIGKFGVGFKSVFAYTETPEIHSGEFHFRIRDFVVPDTTEMTSVGIGKKTRFIFPFDHPKKTKEKAVAEIQKGLIELSDQTLLFLKHIDKLDYYLPDDKSGHIKRILHKNNRVEIQTSHPIAIESVDCDCAPESSSNWLKFTKTVKITDEEDEGLVKSCDIAIAYQLESIVGTDANGEEKNETKELTWKIIPCKEGHVCIYFPAVKETSKLQFYMHAPFASTVARDSVRHDCNENKELRNHLTSLVVNSMADIKKYGLLTVEFLSVLPVPQDRLKEFYLPFQSKIVEAFKYSKLTPTKNGKHEKAICMKYGSEIVTTMLSEKDIQILSGNKRLRWLADSKAGEPGNDFLQSLEIEGIDTDNFVELLCNKTSCIPEKQIEPDKDVMKWLKSKSDRWLKRMYAFIYQENSYFKNYDEVLINAHIVRLDNKELSVAEGSYFPNRNFKKDKKYPCVKKGIYASGKDEQQNEHAQKLLQSLGVKFLDESVFIETILKERYSKNNLKPEAGDPKRFIEFLKKNRSRASMFSDFYVLKKKDSDRWAIPRILYLDAPLSTTDLRYYYEESNIYLNRSTKKYEFDYDYYLGKGISKADLYDFASAIGVEVALIPETEDKVRKNPKYRDLKSGTGRVTKNHREGDFMIPGLREFLEQRNLKLSRIIWNLMSDLRFNSNYYFEAYYKKNASSITKRADSQFIHCLKNTEWVPQRQTASEGELYFVKPCDADSKKLPTGFRYEKDQEWLKRIKFGHVKYIQSEEQRKKQAEYTSAAKALGLDGVSRDELSKMKAVQLHKDEFKRQMAESESGLDRRYEKIGKDSRNAPRRQYEIKKRKVRIKRVHKDDVLNYLSIFYQRVNDHWTCQICSGPMPFLKKDGSEYCEKRELLNGKWATGIKNKLRNEKMPEYEKLFIVLCPLCNRFYGEYVSNRDEQQKTLLEWLRKNDGNEFTIHSSKCKSKEPDRQLVFHRKHVGDIRAVLTTNYKLAQEDN